MNEFSSHPAPSTPIQLADEYPLMPSEQPSTCAIVFGQFLAFGLLGQIIFTLLVFYIPQTHHGNTKIPDSPGETLISLVLCLPPVFAVVGAIAGYWKPIIWFGHEASMAFAIVAIIPLSVFDLFMLRLWSFAGYC